MYRVSLDDEARNELKQRAHEQNIDPSVRDRLEMLRLSDAGWSIPRIGRHMQQHEQTVRFWIKQYLQDGFDALKNKPRGGSESRLSPDAYKALEAILDYEAAGNPMNDEKWVRSSSIHLSAVLKEQGFEISSTTVRRVLKKLGYSMRINVKKKPAYDSDDPHVTEQFNYIASQRRTFCEAGLSIISVDTKKKELIGNFQRKGKAWSKIAEEVNYYDFTSLAVCRAVPYGIYDVTHNKGYVYVGTSGDTAEFAADALARWWKDEGSLIYPEENKLLILSDGGGCNGWRSRPWKQQIQTKLCDKFGLTVTVCHYPPGCSKWNPVERLLFSRISTNWAGKPLRTLQIMLAYIRGTTTSTRLTVKAFLQEGVYDTGQRVTKAELDLLSLQPHEVCPNWNYTISPRTSTAVSKSLDDIVEPEKW